MDRKELREVLALLYAGEIEAAKERIEAALADSNPVFAVGRPKFPSAPDALLDMEFEDRVSGLFG